MYKVLGVIRFYTVYVFKLLNGVRISTAGLSGAGSGFLLRTRKPKKLVIRSMNARENLRIFVDDGSLTINDSCFFNNDCSINCQGEIVIGSGTIFGEGVRLYDHDHVIYDDYSVSKTKFTVGNIKIGSGCWIGSGTIILKGVELADNVIIAASSVVTKSISYPGVYLCNGSKVKKLK